MGIRYAWLWDLGVRSIEYWRNLHRADRLLDHRSPFTVILQNHLVVPLDYSAAAPCRDLAGK
jgi:hypothetical protein